MHASLASPDDTAAELLARYFDPTARAVDIAGELGMSLATYSKTLLSPLVADRLDLYEHLHTRRIRLLAAAALPQAIDNLLTAARLSVSPDQLRKSSAILARTLIKLLEFKPPDAPPPPRAGPTHQPVSPTRCDGDAGDSPSPPEPTARAVGHLSLIHI